MKPALLIIDMQNDVMAKMGSAGTALLPNISEVLGAFRRKALPIVHVKRVHRADGSDVEAFRLAMFKKKPFLVRGTKGQEIIDELKPLDGEYIIEKQRFSAFFQTELQLLLNRFDIDTLVITGVQTPNCVRATVVDGIGYDYHMVLLDDAVAAASEEVHIANVFDMKNMGVEILKVDEFIKK